MKTMILVTLGLLIQAPLLRAQNTTQRIRELLGRLGNHAEDLSQPQLEALFPDPNATLSLLDGIERVRSVRDSPLRYREFQVDDFAFHASTDTGPPSVEPFQVIDEPNFLDSQFFAIGARVVHTVCMITSHPVGGPSDPLRGVTVYGTGFLVSRSHVMTSRHVIPQAPMTGEYAAVFDYSTTSTPISIPIRAGYLDKEDADGLDFGIVELDMSLYPEGFERRGHLELARVGRPPDRGEWGARGLIIIGHPDSRRQEAVVNDSHILEEKPPYLLYNTDTERGASGSPVFLDDFTLIGIHAGSVRLAGDLYNVGVRLDTIVSRLSRDSRVAAALGL